MRITNTDELLPQHHTLYLVRRVEEEKSTCRCYTNRKEVVKECSKPQRAEWVAVSREQITIGVHGRIFFAVESICECSVHGCPSLMPWAEKKRSCARFVGMPFRGGETTYVFTIDQD